MEVVVIFEIPSSVGTDEESDILIFENMIVEHDGIQIAC